MAKRGFHQTGEVFAGEIIANPNPVAINAPEGFLLEWWNIFYEISSSRFPEVALVTTESFDKVAQTVENIVPNINPENSTFAPNHTGANISNVMPVMPSPHLMASSPLMESSGPDLMDAKISDLLSSFDTGYVLPDLYPPRDMTSGLQFRETSEMGGMIPFASNSGGFHQTGEVFSSEIRANQNLVAINSPHEAFLQAWWGKLYEAYRYRFLDYAVFAAESFDKVAQTVENVVANNGPANRSYASDHTGANISNVMPVMLSPHLMASSPVMESSGPDLMDTKISDLSSSFDTGYVLPDLSPQRDMTSGLQFPEMREMGGMLPFASNSGYQMQQMPTVPPEWNARDDRPGINLGGPTRMEPNLCLPPWLEPSDAGNNRSLQQASHQGWPLLGVGSVSPVINHQVVRPSVIVPAQKMLGDTNQRTLENLTVDQQITALIGGVQQMKSGKQAAAQEQMNQLRLQSSKKVGKDDIDNYFSQGDADLFSASKSIYALRKSFATHNQAEWKGISFKEISSLHATKSKLLCCHFHSQGKLLATAGHERKFVIWDLENYEVNSGEGHAHVFTDIRFKPNSTVFATSSFDRTVMIWDAAKPSNPFQNLVGHAEHVMSIDFHPTKVGLLSSCDSNDEIRLWDVHDGDCKLIFKGGSRQVRFQPRPGNLLASSTGNIINIFDVETNSVQQQLRGHVKDVRSICWDMTGNYLASVSEHSARIWSISDGKCIHELWSSDNKFQSCTFHPEHAQLLVIGSYELLELWNPIFQSNRTWPH